MHYKFGYLLNKRYIFLKYINYGAFSQIWLIYDILLNDYCIAKVIDSDNIETGRNEINILRKLKRLLISNNNLINNILLFREIIESEKENFKKISKLIDYFKVHDVMAENIADELDFNSSICDILSTSSDMAYRYSRLLREKLTEININI